MSRPRRPKQQELAFRSWGGKRRNAGRKRRSDETVPHLPRPALSHRHPVHLTLRMRREVWQLRSQRCFKKIRHALVELTKRRGVGFVHFSVQGNHIHLIAEAANRSSLSRGVQALAIRIARGLNAVMNRRGKVFAERYHEHVLKTPLEVHRALSYVLRNQAKHAAEWGGSFAAIDRYSSAAWFTGWSGHVDGALLAAKGGATAASGAGTALVGDETLDARSQDGAVDVSIDAIDVSLG